MRLHQTKVLLTCMLLLCAAAVAQEEGEAAAEGEEEAAADAAPADAAPADAAPAAAAAAPAAAPAEAAATEAAVAAPTTAAAPTTTPPTPKPAAGSEFDVDIVQPMLTVKPKRKSPKKPASKAKPKQVVVLPGGQNNQRVVIRLSARKGQPAKNNNVKKQVQGKQFKLPRFNFPVRSTTTSPRPTVTNAKSN